VAVGDRSGHGYASYLVFGPPFRLSRGAGRLLRLRCQNMPPNRPPWPPSRNGMLP
jgi:hypothetical protein